MKDIIINVDSTSHKVNFPDEFLGIGYENLQGNLIFQFDNNFIGGQARLDISIDCESGMIPNLTPYENGYILPIKSSLLTGSNVLMQLVIDETSLTQYSLTTDTEINPNKTYYEKVGNDYIVVENPVVGDLSQYYEANTPVFKTDIFQLKVKDSINAQETIPEQYPTWINTLNTLIGTINQKLGLVDTALTEMNNLNINVSDKVNGEVTITFTDKQGTQKEVKINDGRGIVSILKTATSGNIDTYTITYTDDTTRTFEVTNGIDGTDGRGIVSIEKTETTGLVDTYTITYTDNTTSIFNVANGKGITNIEKISTNLLVDTYRISFNDGTTQNYEVTNGKGIVSIQKTSTEGLTDIYTITYNDETTATFNVVNGKGIVSIEKTSTSGYVDTYTITYNDGTTSTYEVTNGEVSQAQLDALQDELNYYKTIVNALPKITGSGTSITLDNTANAGMTLELNPSELSQDGEPTPSSPQDIHTISGDNTIKVKSGNALENAIWSKGRIETDGNVNTSSTWSYCDYIDVSKGNWVLETKQISADIPKIAIYDSNKSFIRYFNISNNTIIKLWEYNAYYIRTSIDNTISISDRELLYQEQTAQLNLGDLEYSAIGNYKDQFYKPSGSNLLNRATCEENKLLRWAQGDTYNETGSLVSDYIKVNIGDKIYANYNYQKMFYDINKNYIGALQNDGSVSTNSNGNMGSNFIVPNVNGIAYMRLGFRTSSNSNIDLLNTNIMVNKGSTLLPYEPHDTTKWYLKKNIGKYVANNDLTGNGSSDTRVDLLTPVLNITANLTANILAQRSKNNLLPSKPTGSIGQGLAGTTRVNEIRVQFSKEYCSDYATANTFLTNNNFTIHYALANPTYILLNDTLQEELNIIEKLLSYQGQTNISQTNNDLPFIIDSTALKDLTSL